MTGYAQGMTVVRRASRLTAGLTIGAATAVVELVYVLGAVPILVIPAGRRGAIAGAYRLTEWERRRLRRFHGDPSTADYTAKRALQYLSVRWAVGVLGAGVLLLIVLGAATGAALAWQLLDGHGLGGASPSSWPELLTYLLLGAVLVFITVQGLLGAAALDRKLAYRMLGPSETEQLRRRVSELTVSRAEVIEAVNDERRRIERALHDGVQQRLVGLGMVLGRARRASDVTRASHLLRQAHEEAQETLHDLREVTWRVYPVALDDGLHAALEALAERCGLPVALRYELTERPSKALETAAYFVVSEALTNAVKHANATQVGIDVLRDDSMITVRISDNGTGGATTSRPGLSGLRRRITAEDGELTVESPAGGPTTITATLPHEEAACE